MENVIIGTIVVLVITVIWLVDRLVRTNERLLVALTSKSGDAAGTRALLAMDKPPQRTIRGVAEDEKKAPVGGIVMTYGGEVGE